jgi:hypothetical protein
MKTQEILFSKTLEQVSDEYAPKPAFKYVPEWYKKIETRFPIEKNPSSLPTIKKCIPVLDAITAGYIIVSPCDVYVSIKDGEVQYTNPLGIIEFHPRKQAYNHPQANIYQFPKWINPWAIKTPKGYSCYFKPPAHNPNPWFEILEGFVDTDTYSAPVNFPFVLLNPEKECLIPAGTPIAQVIPVKRDSWQMSTNNEIENQSSVIKLLNSQFFDRYKRMFWEKKEYK